MLRAGAGHIHLVEALANTVICFSSVLRLGTLGSPASGEHMARALEGGPKVLDSIPAVVAASSYDPE